MFDTGFALGGLDVTLDYVTSLMAPKNYRVVSGEPYANYDEMKADYDRKGFLTVSRDHSEKTIYGTPFINYAARAWHDMAHLTIGADFSKAGEHRAYTYQLGQLASLIYNNPANLKGQYIAAIHRWSMLLDYEVNGQIEILESTGSFPDDQRAACKDWIYQKYGILPGNRGTFSHTLQGFSLAY